MTAIYDLRSNAMMQEDSGVSNVPPAGCSDGQGIAEACGEQLTSRPDSILTRNELPCERVWERCEPRKVLTMYCAVAKSELAETPSPGTN